MKVRTRVLVGAAREAEKVLDDLTESGFDWPADVDRNNAIEVWERLANALLPFADTGPAGEVAP